MEAMMWNDGYWGHGAGWEGWVMLMFMIVFVVAVVVAVVFLVRYLAQPQGIQAQVAQAQVSQAQLHQTAPFAPAPDAPQEILKRRYAAGEIEREEYLQKLADL